MFRKEKLLFFAILGLACVYGVLWLLVRLTRGRFAGLVKNKLTVGMLIIFFSSFIGSGMAFSQTEESNPLVIALYGVPGPTATLPFSPTPLYGTPPPTPTSTPSLTPSPNPTVLYGIPCVVEIRLSSTTVPINTQFTIDVNISTMTDKVAAYGLDMFYDAAMLDIITVRAGADGYMTVANLNNPGTITVTGFDVRGIGPGNNMEFLQMDFHSAVTPGQTTLKLNIKQMTTPDYRDLWTATNSATVTIVDTILPGDVDGNKIVDIVDALKIARHTVGMTPPDFNPGAADVNRDGVINIVDALMVAQKFVGLIDEFPQG